MTTHTLALAIAYVSSVVGVAQSVPQIVRAVRHPHMGGVAPLSWAITAVACTAWITYGVRAGIGPQIPGNVLLVTGSVAIVLLVPSGLSRARRAALLGSAALVVVAVSSVLPPEGAGFLGFGIGLFAAWPQVVTTLRGSREKAGVSLATLGLRLASGLGWFTYAILARDVPVIFSVTVMIGTTLLVLVVEGQRRGAPALGEIGVLEPA